MESLRNSLQLAEDHEAIFRSVCEVIADCYIRETPLESISVDISWCPYATLSGRLRRYMLETYPEMYIEIPRLMTYLDYAYDFQ